MTGRRRAVRPRRGVSAICWPRGDLAGYEVPSASTRSARPTGLAETRAYLARAQGRPTDELRHSSIWTKRRGSSRQLDADAIERMVDAARRRCATAAAGCSSSASAAAPANCSHAVNDFRKIAGFEAYAPTDNVSELTARTNDEGWETVFVEWLKGSRLRARGHACSCFGRRRQPREEHQPEPGARAAATPSRSAPTIVGVVGRDGGYTAQGRRRLRDRADGQSRDRHAARRGVPGGGLAPAGVASAR